MELLSIDQAAELAGVSDRTVRNWARGGKVKRYTSPEGRACYRREEIEAQRNAVPEAFRNLDGKGPEESLSPLAARAEALERENEFLRQQLEYRAEETARRDQAEAELRRLMAALTEANRHLTGMLEQKALPPAVEVKGARRVKWWGWWRR